MIDDKKAFGMRQDPVTHLTYVVDIICIEDDQNEGGKVFCKLIRLSRVVTTPSGSRKVYLSGMGSAFRNTDFLPELPEGIIKGAFASDSVSVRGLVGGYDKPVVGVDVIYSRVEKSQPFLLS